MSTEAIRRPLAANSASAMPVPAGLPTAWAVHASDMPALLTSLLVHVIVLLALGLVVIDPPIPARTVTVIESPAVVDEDVPLEPQEMGRPRRRGARLSAVL